MQWMDNQSWLIRATICESHAQDCFFPSVFLLSYLTSLVFLLLELRFGVRTSAAQFFFYLTSVICGAVTLRSVVKAHKDETGAYDHRTLTVFSLQYSFLALLFLFNLKSDARAKNYDPSLASLKKPCPQIGASFYTQLTYGWVTKLLWKGKLLN